MFTLGEETGGRLARLVKAGPLEKHVGGAP